MDGDEEPAMLVQAEIEEQRAERGAAREIEARLRLRGGRLDRGPPPGGGERGEIDARERDVLAGRREDLLGSREAHAERVVVRDQRGERLAQQGRVERLARREQEGLVEM